MGLKGQRIDSLSGASREIIDKPTGGPTVQTRREISTIRIIAEGIVDAMTVSKYHCGEWVRAYPISAAYCLLNTNCPDECVEVTQKLAADDTIVFPAIINEDSQRCTLFADFV